MLKLILPARRLAAVALLLGSASLSLSALAQTTPAVTPVAAPAAATPEAKAAMHSQRIESHIATLKKKLMITDAEGAEWEKFAAVMRENGMAMESVIKERVAGVAMTAPQDLQSYAKLSQVHADAAQKLAAAFQPLYDSLSPAQKLTADKLFDATRHGKMGGAKKK